MNSFVIPAHLTPKAVVTDSLTVRRSGSFPSLDSLRVVGGTLTIDEIDVLTGA